MIRDNNTNYTSSLKAKSEIPRAERQYEEIYAGDIFEIRPDYSNG